MSSHLVFNGVDDAVKARLETYWAKKLSRVQKLLVPYPADLQEIRLTVSHHEQNARRSRYEVRAVIHLPTGTVAAEADDDDPQVALDRVADTLTAEIRRHKEKARRDYIYKRKNRNRADLSAAGPQLQQHAADGRREDFFRLIRPHLGFLRTYARRELRILEQNGTLRRGELTVDDLLDQVMVLAYERFANRPRKLSLDLWLTDLLQEALEQWIKQVPRPHLSLEDQVEKVLSDEVPREDEEEWWTELIGDEETLTLGDLVPGSDGTEVWDKLETEEQRNRLLSLVGQLPPLQRQAFLLHALENYATDAIAMLQNRPEGQVKADIEAARNQLREGLLADGLVEEAGELATASGAAK